MTKPKEKNTLGDISKKYGISFSEADDMLVSAFLKKKGYKSLSRLLGMTAQPKEKKQDWEREFRHKWEGANSGSMTIDGIIKDISSLIEQTREEARKGVEKMDDLEKLRIIKQMIPTMLSANLELIMPLITKSLRTNAVREWMKLEKVSQSLSSLQLLKNKK